MKSLKIINSKRATTILICCLLIFIIFSVFILKNKANLVNNQAIALNNSAVEYFDKSPLKALEFLEQAIALDPVYKIAYSNKAMLLKKSGRREEALNTINKLIKIAPHVPEYYLGRAMFFHDKQNKIEIERDYKKAILLFDEQLIKNPKNSSPRSQRAYVYFLIGKKEIAMRELNDMLKDNPEDIGAQNIKEIIELQKAQKLH